MGDEHGDSPLEDLLLRDVVVEVLQDDEDVHEVVRVDLVLARNLRQQPENREDIVLELDADRGEIA